MKSFLRKEKKFVFSAHEFSDMTETTGWSTSSPSSEDWMEDPTWVKDPFLDQDYTTFFSSPSSWSSPSHDATGAEDRRPEEERQDGEPQDRLTVVSPTPSKKKRETKRSPKKKWTNTDKPNAPVEKQQSDQRAKASPEKKFTGHSSTIVATLSPEKQNNFKDQSKVNKGAVFTLRSFKSKDSESITTKKQVQQGPVGKEEIVQQRQHESGLCTSAAAPTASATTETTYSLKSAHASDEGAVEDTESTDTATEVAMKAIVSERTKKKKDKQLDKKHLERSFALMDSRAADGVLLPKRLKHSKSADLRSITQGRDTLTRSSATEKSDPSSIVGTLEAGPVKASAVTSADACVPKASSNTSVRFSKQKSQVSKPQRSKSQQHSHQGRRAALGPPEKNNNSVVICRNKRRASLGPDGTLPTAKGGKDSAAAGDSIMRLPWLQLDSTPIAKASTTQRTEMSKSEAEDVKADSKKKKKKKNNDKKKNKRQHANGIQKDTSSTKKSATKVEKSDLSALGASETRRKEKGSKKTTSKKALKRHFNKHKGGKNHLKPSPRPTTSVEGQQSAALSFSEGFDGVPTTSPSKWKTGTTVPREKQKQHRNRSRSRDRKPLSAISELRCSSPKVPRRTQKIKQLGDQNVGPTGGNKGENSVDNARYKTTRSPPASVIKKKSSLHRTRSGKRTPKRSDQIRLHLDNQSTPEIPEQSDQCYHKFATVAVRPAATVSPRGPIAEEPKKKGELSPKSARPSRESQPSPPNDDQSLHTTLCKPRRPRSIYNTMAKSNFSPRRSRSKSRGGRTRTTMRKHKNKRKNSHKE